MYVNAIMMTGSLAAGAAASATLHTFSASAGDAPAKVELFTYTTPNYGNAVTTTLFVIAGTTGTVMWSGSAIARNTAKTEGLSAYNVYVQPGDYVYAIDSADNGGAAIVTVKCYTVLM